MNAEFREKPLRTYRCTANETVLVSTSYENEFISIVGGENVKPEYLTNHIFREEFSHQQAFPTRKFGFQRKGKVQLSLFNYFNQLMLNCAQKF